MHYVYFRSYAARLCYRHRRLSCWPPRARQRWRKTKIPRKRRPARRRRSRRSEPGSGISASLRVAAATRRHACSGAAGGARGTAADDGDNVLPETRVVAPVERRRPRTPPPQVVTNQPPAPTQAEVVAKQNQVFDAARQTILAPARRHLL